MTQVDGASIPFLHWSDADGEQQILQLPPGRARFTIGRRLHSDVALSWDIEISRTHAVLERAGEEWILADEGLSRNGSFVNGSRVDGRRTLQDEDRLRFGRTEVVYRCSSPAATQSRPDGDGSLARLTASQLGVLVALCRPMVESDAAAPATNQEIAAEVSLSVHAVAAHMHDLTERFGLSHLPEDEKRTRLVAVVLRVGLLAPADF
jgi:predicted component of type VI protein secretion system